MKEEIYEIEGMHCAACSAAVERVTKKLPGVKSSEVNLLMKRLTIRYDEKQTTPEMIINKIEKAGFHASRQEIEKPKQDHSMIPMLSAAFLLLVLSMGPMVIKGMPLPDLLSMHTHPQNYAIIQMVLCLFVLFFGRKFFISGYQSLFHGNPNMDTLVAISSTASFLYSFVMTLLISDQPHSVHNLYYESAAIVVALVSLGKHMEAQNMEKTKSAITRLMSLAPDTAILVNKTGEQESHQEVAANTIKTGEVILVKKGMRIPLDGVIVSGNGSINEAMLTGESMPVEKLKEDHVIGGSILTEGLLYVKVTHTGADTTLSKIIKFVEDAQGKKAPISKIADQVAGVFVPIVVLISLASAIIWLLSGAQFAFVIKIFTSILVIACPCAMGLATPTAIIVGTGLGASNGILIRSGEALEITHKVTTTIFDKTGTITTGNPIVSAIVSEHSADEEELLQIAYSLETLSQHPLSKAICQEAEYRIDTEKMHLAEYQLHDYVNLTGKGLSARNEQGVLFLAGNQSMMEDFQIDTSVWQEKALGFQSQGKTVVFIAKATKLLGLIAISDAIKEDAAAAVSKLKQMGIKTVLLTGDSEASAQYIGEQAGTDLVYAKVLPTEKADYVKKFQEKGEVVLMVGDGINDAPALTQADIGCAIGNGSDIAIDSAQIVLMKNQLMDVPRAIHLSKQTIRNIKQNLFWAFCYNVLCIPIAAGVLYPMTGILLSPMIGAVAMSLSSLFVVTNALRLGRRKI
ncbi:MAG: copper-translocating P-type ATPase [Clostridia bacterium]|nr:copper-translocating P-type ATPase [Clostridia bacterium]